MNPLKQILSKAIIALFITLAANQNILADDYSGEPKHYDPSAEAMILDGLVVRPFSLAGTVIGTGVFVITLPFTLFSGSVEQAGERLIAEPANYTFKRCLGCLRVDKRKYDLRY